MCIYDHIICTKCLSKKKRNHLIFGEFLLHNSNNNNNNEQSFLSLSLSLLLFITDFTSGGFQGPVDGFNSIDETTTASTQYSVFSPKLAEPYFDAMIQKNVTALVGKSAYLSCKVRNLGNKTVRF